jgi:hypothetical protein
LLPTFSASPAGDPDGHRAASKRAHEECPGSTRVAALGDEHVDDLPVLFDRRKCQQNP